MLCKVDLGDDRLLLYLDDCTLDLRSSGHDRNEAVVVGGTNGIENETGVARQIESVEGEGQLSQGAHASGVSIHLRLSLVTAPRCFSCVTTVLAQRISVQAHPTGPLYMWLWNTLQRGALSIHRSTKQPISSHRTERRSFEQSPFDHEPKYADNTLLPTLNPSNETIYPTRRGSSGASRSSDRIKNGNAVKIVS